MRHIEHDKLEIIRRFFKEVYGKRPDLSSYNGLHDGKGGHWLESKMGIKINSSNSPDINGYEMKNNTSSKTTFGDWSPDLAIFKGHNSIDRDTQFLVYFGKPNANKNNRYSWSGEPVPKIGGFNDYGQKLEIDEYNNILAVYSYSQDKRENKSVIIPNIFKIENLVIAKWEAASIKRKLESKFNSKGWFKCNMDSSGFYSEIVFGDPLNFESWLDMVRSGDVIFDSGMYQGNIRPYSQWRSMNSVWEKMITSRYSHESVNI